MSLRFQVGIPVRTLKLNTPEFILTAIQIAGRRVALEAAYNIEPSDALVLLFFIHQVRPNQGSKREDTHT